MKSLFKGFLKGVLSFLKGLFKVYVSDVFGCLRGPYLAFSKAVVRACLRPFKACLRPFLRKNTGGDPTKGIPPLKGLLRLA